MRRVRAEDSDDSFDVRNLTTWNDADLVGMDDYELERARAAIMAAIDTGEIEGESSELAEYHVTQMAGDDVLMHGIINCRNLDDAHERCARQIGGCCGTSFTLRKDGEYLAEFRTDAAGTVYGEWDAGNGGTERFRWLGNGCGWSACLGEFVPCFD